MSGDLLAHLAAFARALRDRGMRVGLSEEVDGAAALAVVDLLDRAEVRCALRATLRIRRDDLPLFDELFDAYFAEVEVPAEAKRPSRPARTPALPRGGAQAVPVGLAPASLRDRPEGEEPGYSPELLLRHKAFDQCTAQDLAEMERLLARLSIKLATRPSRRRVPTRGRGVIDLRRSFRRALATRGELLAFARRARAIEEPRLVFLCDTSGSMDPHSRFLLAFLLCLKRVAPRTEAFAFNTSLTRLTNWLAPRKIALTLDRLAAGVPDWSGGTRIGGSLREFVERYGRLLDAQTVVVILSDGLDQGEPDELAAAMRTMRAKVRRVIWLNPLLGDARYTPTARGMAAALPYVHRFAAAHDLASLERLASYLAA